METSDLLALLGRCSAGNWNSGLWYESGMDGGGGWWKGRLEEPLFTLG